MKSYSVLLIAMCLLPASVISEQRKFLPGISKPPLVLKTVISRQHKQLLGAEGLDIYKVPKLSSDCQSGKNEIFDHAQIKFMVKRFSDANIIYQPDKGCTQCKDIRVRWYNEPTGKLHYQLLIFVKRVIRRCQ